MPPHICANCEQPPTNVPDVKYLQLGTVTNVASASRGPNIFECNRPIKTAYYIACAVEENLFPDHDQAREDYGFKRAFSVENSTKLFGLYIGLIECMGVGPKTLHEWRVSGRLVEEIKVAFNMLPEGRRGGYYPWFLENQWILDVTLPAQTSDVAHEMMNRGWRYATNSPTVAVTVAQIQADLNAWPQDKHTCFSLCAGALSKWRPNPEQDTWLYFGFCACPDEVTENGCPISKTSGKMHI